MSGEIRSHDLIITREGLEGADLIEAPAGQPTMEEQDAGRVGARMGATRAEKARLLGGQPHALPTWGARAEQLS